MIHTPRGYRRAQRALKTAQRRVSRRKKGSARRRQAVTRLARAHVKVKRQRQDFQHKEVRKLVRTNDTIYHEDVQTANMLKTHYRAKSIASRLPVDCQSIASRLPTRAGVSAWTS